MLSFAAEAAVNRSFLCIFSGVKCIVCPTTQGQYAVILNIMIHKDLLFSLW